MSPAEALIKYKDQLTALELAEISQYETIYTIGSYRVTANVTKNDGTYRAHAGE